ncbi:MAG: sulfotransferase family protein [Candidatus Thorarchaeota archaeon]
MIDCFKEAIENRYKCNDPILVMGPARSGTGMISRALSMCRDTVYLGETHLFTSVLLRRAKRSTSLLLSRKYHRALFSSASWAYAQAASIKDLFLYKDRLAHMVHKTLCHVKGGDYPDLKPSNPIHRVRNVKLKDEEQCLRDELIKKYNSLLKKDPARFPSIFFEDIRILSGKKFVIEKTPNNYDYISLILHIFPKARIVLTHREDLRNMIASYFLMTGDKPATAKYSRRLSKINTAIDRIHDNYGNRVNFVCYDNVLSSPTEEITRLCETCDLNVTERLRNNLIEIFPRKPKFEQLSEEDQRYVDSILAHNKK